MIDEVKNIKDELCLDENFFSQYGSWFRKCVRLLVVANLACAMLLFITTILFELKK